MELCFFRLERALEELGGYRKAAGRSSTPDFNEEDRLRADLHNSEAQKRQLGQDSQALANLVLNLAHKQALASQTTVPQGRLFLVLYMFFHCFLSLCFFLAPSNFSPAVFVQPHSATSRLVCFHMPDMFCT